MTIANVFYAQSGGVTAVLNATACGVIQAAKKHSDKIGTVYAGHNGILGALKEELINTSKESDATIAALRHTPGGLFGSCRYKLKNPEENNEEYLRLIEVFKAHHIRYFLYNGGGDSQDTALKVAKASAELNYPLTCIGIPKTVDNDLAITDNCPGFGSAAKYIAVSIKEAGLDIASMAATSTKVFVMEVMGRHAGWIAAASGLARQTPEHAPHIILFPEVPFDAERFLKKVDESVKRYQFCAVVVSEGLRDDTGQFISKVGLTDAFGNQQLGGVAPMIARLIKSSLGYKYHWAVSDYLQRAARHIASRVDVEQAYALGKTAIEKALTGVNNVMLTIERLSSSPYQWQIGQTELTNVACVEKTLPTAFITEDGFGITEPCREYLSPLIQGEDYPPYLNGLPVYATLKKEFAAKKCRLNEGEFA